MPPSGGNAAPRVIGIIPARWESRRLQGKMLANLGGKPLVVRTLEVASRCQLLDEVLVATDDERIQEAIASEGSRAIMTSPELKSGSDRILAALETLEDETAEIIVNIQGDEPLLPETVIDKTVKLLLDNPEFGVTTAACPLESYRREDPNAVKVVTDLNGRALYFSRSVLPYPRQDSPPDHLYRRHIGIYVYRREILKAFCSWPRSELEYCEKLEQLRLLEHGISIGVVDVEDVPPGVDTREDLRRIRRLFPNQDYMD